MLVVPFPYPPSMWKGVYALLVLGYIPSCKSFPTKEKKGEEMITALLFWVIVGLIAGALAKLIMPGDDPGGIIVTIIIGIIGAVIGGWLLSLLGIGAGAGSGGFIFSIIAGIIGAVILLAIYRAVVGGRRT